jgi:hypothetical protein
MEATITTACRDCGDPFDVEAGERAFMERKGFPLPRRCSACRTARKATDAPVDQLERLLLGRIIDGVARIIADERRAEAVKNEEPGQANA